MAVDTYGCRSRVLSADVALRAVRLHMCARQRKGSLVVIFKLRGPPRRGSVTLFACIRECGFVVGWIYRCCVICRMALNTRAACVRKS